MKKSFCFRLPAEWEPHQATFLAWPFREEDFTQKYLLISWLYAEFVRVLSHYEPVEILCFTQELSEAVTEILEAVGIDPGKYRIHIGEYTYVWLRDTAPTGVFDARGRLNWIQWGFTGWARVEGADCDDSAAEVIQKVSGCPIHRAQRSDTDSRFVLEGGSFDVDGQGTVLVTEENLLTGKYVRNVGLSKESYEDLLSRYLGATKTLWLRRSCRGDKTGGHIDQTARFAAPGKVLLSFEEDTKLPEHKASKENLERLESSVDGQGRAIDVIRLPMPSRATFDGKRFPASYTNFYIANKVVLVPTFNDKKDSLAISIISSVFPDRDVIGIASRELALVGGGSLHCITQQWPAVSGFLAS